MSTFDIIFTVSLTLVVCAIFGFTFFRVVQAIKEHDIKKVLLSIGIFLIAMIIIYGGLVIVLLNGIM